VATRLLLQLARRGEIDPSLPAQAVERYRLHDVGAGTTGSTGGEA
jgi:pyruvate dehydrogenase E1 component